MKHTYTTTKITPLFDSCFRGWVVCAVISACIYNSADMLYKNAEMQYGQINGTIEVNSLSKDHNMLGGANGRHRARPPTAAQKARASAAATKAKAKRKKPAKKPAKKAK